MSEEFSQDDPKIRAEIEAATVAILERLTAIGWIESARSEERFAVKWTQSGIEAAKQFGILFNKLGKDISGIELVALYNIIQTMSPGGSDSQQNAIR